MSELKIRISTRVIDLAVRPEALNSPKHWKSPSPPDSRKEIGSGPVISITFLELVLILPINFHSDLSTLNVSQDFYFSPPPPMTPDPI